MDKRRDKDIIFAMLCDYASLRNVFYPILGFSKTFWRVKEKIENMELINNCSVSWNSKQIKKCFPQQTALVFNDGKDTANSASQHYLHGCMARIITSPVMISMG